MSPTATRRRRSGSRAAELPRRVGRAIGSAPRALGGGLAAAARAVPPAWRRRLVMVAVLIGLLALGWFGWFRDSSFAQVEQVRVTGIEGPQAGAVKAALTDAARNMTTLHVREDELREAVDAFPTITKVTAKPDFPHKLLIQVREDPPVGAIAYGSERIPVARDGSLLKGVRYDHHLPLIAAPAPPGATRIEAGQAHRLLTVLTGAPELMLRRVRDVRLRKGRGIVVRLRRGPDLIFGDATRPRAKWLAATRVLASRSAQGATYIDLRLPERPAAGGLGEESVSPTTTPGADAAQAAAPTETTPAPAGTTPPQAAPAPVQTAPAPEAQP